MKRRSLLRLVAVLTLFGMLAAACGDDDDGDDAGQEGGDDKELTAAPGFDPVKGEINLGVITPLTGAVAAIGNPLTNGNKTWFDYLNQERGGIAGKYKVVLKIEDSQYIPQNGVQAYNKIKGDVVMIAQLLGTPVTNAVLPQLRTDNLVAAPASLDAEWVRDKNLLPVGGPYQIQMINAADWLLNEGGGKGKVVCTMIQDDVYGEAGQEGVEFAAKELGFTIKTTARFKQAAPDFTAQIQQLRSNGCQVVFLVSTPSDTGKALGTAAQGGFAPQWIGQSPSYIGALAASPLKDYLARTFFVAAEGTEWGDTSVPGMKDMLDRLQKYQPSQQPDYYFAFGYNQARAVTAVLEKAVELGDLSRAGIVKALEELGTVTFDGLSGDYKYGKPADREPPRTSTIFKINPTKPIGIEKVKYNFTSNAAKEFEFEAAAGG
ncbi:MAG TPA: ABC transporter substrate-binding protein [Acidimicrobiales bacterium]|nr:ABC transporter substrate-binding protein [Acidimicrobiales bacterium]